MSISNQADAAQNCGTDQSETIAPALTDIAGLSFGRDGAYDGEIWSNMRHGKGRFQWSNRDVRNVQKSQQR